MSENRLFGTVGTVDWHYVKENPMGFFPRHTYADVTAAGENHTWKGTAWKGDTVNIPLVLWTGSRGKRGVSFEVGGPAEKGYRQEIPAENITVRFQKYLKSSCGSPISAAYKPWLEIAPYEYIPDILDTCGTVDVEAYALQPVWVTVQVPREAAAGKYESSITFRDSIGDVLTFTLQLEVKNIMLPERKDWKYDLQIFHWPTSVWDDIKLPREQFFSPEALEMVRDHYRNLWEAGQNMIWCEIADRPPVPGEGNKYKNSHISQVGWIRKRDGHFTFDFTWFDKWITFMTSLGFDGPIVLEGLIGTDVRYYDELRQESVTVNAIPATPGWETMTREFLEAALVYCDEKGWTDRIFIHVDERPYEELERVLDLVDEVSHKRFKTNVALNSGSLKNPLLDRIEYVSINVGICDEHTQSECVRRREELGLVTTIYNCTTNFPNCFARSNPVENIWAIWDTLRNKTDGFLRWAYDLMTLDPMVTSDNPDFESGDQNFVYPGGRSSVRFECLKEGIRDAVKVQMLSEKSPELKAELDAALQGMATLQEIGSEKEEYGAPKDPGKVDIVAEVRKLKKALQKAEDRYIREYGA